MSQKLPKMTLERLRQLEPALRRASKYGHFNEAHRIIMELQKLFVHNRSHYRILQAKNWYYQAALEDNRVDYAMDGFKSIRIRAAQNTRMYLEATVSLGICYLRKKDIESAKKCIRETISSINQIRSDKRRNQFQRRIVERIEAETILSFLSADNAGRLDPAKVHEEAVKLVRTKSDVDIFRIIGGGLPQNILPVIDEIKDYSINLLPPRDQKLLRSGMAPRSNVTFGKKVVDTMKRVVWRTICDPESQIYNLWKQQVPEIFNKTYFATAIAVTCGKFSIGLPLLAAGVVAIIMKYSAAEFCDNFQPRDIMIGRKEKD